MNNVIEFLMSRNSSPKLVEPAPDAASLDTMFKVGMRAPDHAWLHPWRFITVRGERREALGQVFEQCLMLRKPEADDADRRRRRWAVATWTGSMISRLPGIPIRRTAGNRSPRTA